MTEQKTRPVVRSDRRLGRSEYGVAALLAGLGVLVLLETTRISEALAGPSPVGPKAAPTLVGILLLVTAGLLAVDVLRGGRGAAEAGEDVDLSRGADWPTLLGSVAVFAAAGQLIPRVGLPLAGSILFFGMARLLGSRRVGVDLVVSVLVPVTAYLLFTRGLGVSLPAGWLDPVM